MPVAELSPAQTSWFNRNSFISNETGAHFEALAQFDLAFLEEQLVWKDGFSAKQARECVEEYKKWIALHIAVCDADFVAAHFNGARPALGLPSRHIDAVWHRHILFTREYAAFCEAVAGHMIHHNPCTPHNVATMNANATQKAYRILFGTMPPLWNTREAFLNGVPNTGCGCEITA